MAPPPSTAAATAAKSAKKATAKPSTTKSAALSKPRTHPTYYEMVKDAVVALKERTGSSQPAIAKFIEEKQKNQLPLNYKKMLSVQLKKLVASGKLMKVKNSYKLSVVEKPVSDKPKKTAGELKKVAIKKKSAAAAKEKTVKKLTVSATTEKKRKTKSDGSVKAKKAPAKKATSLKSPAKKVNSLKPPVKKVKTPLKKTKSIKPSAAKKARK